MPFQYTAPENRFANSIAATLLRQGDTGAIWGNAIRGVGQDVAGAIQQATDPRRQLELQALQRQKELQAGQKTVDQALQPVQPQGPQEPGQPPPQAKSPYLTEDGLFDIPKLTNVLAASGQAHLAPDLLKGAEAINDSIVKHQELQTQVQTLQQKAADQHTILLGDMADGVQKLVKGGTPIDQALDLVTQPGRATGRFSDQEYQQVRQQLLSLPPDQQQAAMGQLKSAAERVAPPLKQGEVGRYGTPLTPPKPPSTPTELQFDAVSPTSPTAAQSKAAVEAENAAKPQPQPKSLQTKSVLLDGNPAELTFDPADGSWKQGNKPIDSSRVKPIPPAAVQANDKNALTTTALDMAAKAYAESGQMPLGARDKDTQRRIMNRAAELYPKLDPALNKAAFAANQKSLDGLQKQRDAIGAFEQTAKKNIDIFLDKASKVADTGIPLLNAPLRSASGAVLGSADQAAYNAARQVAINEIAKITSNPNLSGSLSDSARHEVEAFNPRSATLKQTIAVMNLLKQDMANRTGALDDQIATIKDRISGGSSEKPKNDPMGIR